jgi:hypothetical protein
VLAPARTGQRASLPIKMIAPRVQLTHKARVS